MVGTERHEARRIDNQLRGRAGRQGDPGQSRFYLSLEDDLMRRFGGTTISGIMERLGVDDDMPIEAGVVSRAIEQSQTRVEGYNFDMRKHVLEYDDVVNKQREVDLRTASQDPDRADAEAQRPAHGAVSTSMTWCVLICNGYQEDWDLEALYRPSAGSTRARK